MRLRTTTALHSAFGALACAGWLAVGAVGAAAGTPARPAGGAGSWVLTATSPGGTYAPTFTGNGLLGVRVPPTGQGYAGGIVPAQSEPAGFYAQPPGAVQQLANIPTWSTLTFADGPVITLRATSYRLEVSQDGSTWRTIAMIDGRTSGAIDVLRFKPVRARFVRLAIAAATGGTQPMLQELSITG